MIINPYSFGVHETDPYWSDVYALLPFDSALNQEVSGNSTWSVLAGATGSVTPVLSDNYGAAQFHIRSSSSVTIAARQFTVEGWVRPSDSSSSYQTIWNAGSTAGIFYRYGKLHWYQGGIRCESGALTIGMAHAFSVSRDSSGIVRLFVNGIKSPADYHGSASIATANMDIGENFLGGEISNCDIDEVRITLDVCRYTSNYTPRTTPFPRG